MATLTSSLVVRLLDQVTAPARKIGAALTGLDKSARGSFGDRLTGAIERNNAALDRTRGRLLDATAGFFILKNAISGPVSAAMEFESAMADVRKVVDFPTPEAFKDFQQSLVELSKVVPISVNGLAAIAAAAGQAGIAGEDLVKFTENAAKVGVAFDISADQAGEAMAKLMTGLGLSIDEVTLLSDAMNHLSNAQASSAAEILDVVRRVGAQSKQFGFSAVEVSAFASAMIAAGAESEVAATSFRNMGMALTRGESATKRQNAAFKTLGLDAAKVAKAMQEDAVGTTVRVLEQIAKLPKEMQAAVSSDLFGNEARALGPLLTNLDLVRDSLALVDEQSKYAGSSFKEFEVRAGTFENALQTFNNQLTAMKIVIGSALIPVINDLMGAITPVIERVSDFIGQYPDLTANVATAAAGLVAFKIATAGLTFVGLLGRGGALSLMAIGFNTVGKAAIAARGAITGTIAMQTALSGGAAYTGLQKTADAAKSLVRVTPGLNLVGPALWAIGGALGALTAPVVAGVAAVASAGLLIWKYWDRLSSIFAGVGRAIGEQLAPAIEAVRPVLDWLSPLGETIAAGWEKASQAISDFVGWIGSFFQQEVLSEEDKAGFEQAGYDAATRMIEAVKSKVGELVQWFAGLPSRILSAIGSIDIGSLIKWPTPPAWLSRLWGGGTTQVEAPAEPSGRVSGHRKRGGPVWPGGSFLVGEGGEPEIFTPKTSGKITPVSKAGGGNFTWTGNVVVQGVTDPVATGQMVAKAIRDELNEMMRGAHSDGLARA